MSVWYCIPSARPAVDAQRCVNAWHGMGYRVALVRDEGRNDVDCDYFESFLPYPGYAQSVNSLAHAILRQDPTCQWIVTGGDDVFPDQTKRADEIAAELIEHFGGTFGVMQPTGDRWGADPNQPNHIGSAYIDRVAASPWMGRDYCERMYGGHGPLYSVYTHMYVDEEAQHVAQKMGCFWQRPDLMQTHEHWARTPGAVMPSFLAEANSPAHWDKYKRLFENRKAAGFPGHEPISVAVSA